MKAGFASIDHGRRVRAKVQFCLGLWKYTSPSVLRLMTFEYSATVVSICLYGRAALNQTGERATVNLARHASDVRVDIGGY